MINKASFYKRVIAYLLDILIVSMVSSIITYFIPNNIDYDIKMKELTDLTASYTNKEIGDDEYIQKSNEISYDISLGTVDMTLITCGISLLYFVVYGYYSNGQTLGKKIIKIRVVSGNNKKLKVNNYLIRHLLVNSVLANMTTSAMIIFLSKSNYLKYYSKVNNIFTIVLLACIILAIYRKDGRGLHDLLGGTRVISVSNDLPQENDDEVKEATYNEVKESTNNVKIQTNNLKNRE